MTLGAQTMQRKCQYRTKISLVFVLLCALTPTSFATMIDDFSTPQSLALTGIPSAVSGPGIIGNSREVFDPFFVASGGVATFTFSFANPGTNVMSITYDGTTALSDGGTFAPTDLTDAGAADQFLLGISGVEGVASVLLAVSDADNIGSVSTTFQIHAPGLYTASLPTGQADFTRIDEVSMILFLSPPPSGAASLSIDYVCTGTLEGGCTTPVAAVPEPGTGLTLAMLVAVLPLLGRKSRYFSTLG